MYLYNLNNYFERNLNRYFRLKKRNIKRFLMMLLQILKVLLMLKIKIGLIHHGKVSLLEKVRFHIQKLEYLKKQ